MSTFHLIIYYERSNLAVNPKYISQLFMCALNLLFEINYLVINGRIILVILIFYGPTAQIGRWLPLLRFLNHKQLDTHGRTPLDEWSARRRGLYLHRTTQHINTRHISMPSAGFEPAIPAPKRQQTYALARAATGIDVTLVIHSVL
jgi:hypothetical protein